MARRPISSALHHPVSRIGPTLARSSISDLRTSIPPLRLRVSAVASTFWPATSRGVRRRIWGVGGTTPSTVTLLLVHHARSAQFSDDFFSIWGDPPSPGGGYAEKGLNLESMKAGTEGSRAPASATSRGGRRRIWGVGGTTPSTREEIRSSNSSPAASFQLPAPLRFLPGSPSLNAEA
jgi:hypothetical protein